MKIYGIHWYGNRKYNDENHLSHDSCVCIINEHGNIEFFAPLERYSRVKRDSSAGVEIFKYFPHLKPKKEDIIAFVNNGIKYKNKENEICVDHHIAHACSSWVFRDSYESCKFLAYDGCGFDSDGKIRHSLIGTINEKGIFVEKTNTIPSSLPLMKPLGAWNVGKLMGLAGYFPDAKEVENTTIKNADPRSLSEKEMKECAGFYKFVVRKIWKEIEKELSLEQVVSISGGSSLALEINSKIRNKSKDVVFCPATDDSGIALGCAVYAYFLKYKKWPNSIKSPSIVSLIRPNLKSGPQNPKEIAKLLNEKKVIGLIRGKAECGPRALGFRSLLASPTYGMKELVSEGLKKREKFRPLAPIVTERQFNRFFDGPMGKYMQYMNNCKESKTIPAVCHLDGTSRPQVIYEQDEWLYELLMEYGKLSGHEVLINTSLNKNKPICNTLNDSIEDFGNTIIHCSIQSSYKVIL